MKKIFLTFLSCSLLLLASCSSKSDSLPILTPSEIVGEYTGTKLVVNVNGAPATFKSIKISGTELNNMTFTMSINEDPNPVTIANVVFSQAQDDVCKFTSKTPTPNNGPYAVMEGVLVNGKLTVNINSIVKEYTVADVVGKYNATKTALKVSGVAYDMTEGQDVEILGTVFENMTIKVPANVVPGEDAIEFTKVVFDSNINCTFSGSVSNSDRTLSIKGSYVDGKILVEITPEYNNELVGTWNFQEPKILDDYSDASQVLLVDVKTPSGTVEFFGSTVPCEALGAFFNMLVGQGILRTYDSETNEYTGAIKNVVFQADGNITAQYNNNFMQNKPAEFVNSPLGGMRWYVKEGKVFLVPNLNMMTKAGAISGISTKGIPMDFKVEGSNVYIYFNKEQVAPIILFAAPIIASLPDSIFGDFSGLVKMMMNDFIKIAQTATQFDLGIVFEKAQK